jgi:hypothetical protein
LGRVFHHNDPNPKEEIPVADDKTVLRELVRRYLDATQTPENDEKRDLWASLNSLDSKRPLVHLRGGRVWDEIPEIRIRECEDPLFARTETTLRKELFRSTIGDDTVFEPWITCRAAFACSGWGLQGERQSPAEAKGAWRETHPLTDLSDLSQLTSPHHLIDEETTAANYAKMQDAVGDLIEIDLDRSPAYQVWQADLATPIGRMRGIQEFMMDVYDRPDELKALLAFMRDGVLRAHEEAEAAGDWGLSAHNNQSMPYANELEHPAPNRRGVKRSDLQCFLAAQELTLVSPQTHDEFMFQYQLPILEPFGMVAYGCCEDLTHKIDMLRQLPNLRRIAVAPTADIEKCAEQIRTDYVISYRPNPADMVCVGYHEDRIRQIIGRALDVFAGQHVEINLKDVDTCEHDPGRLRRWTQLVRSLIEERAGTTA